METPLAVSKLLRNINLDGNSEESTLEPRPGLSSAKLFELVKTCQQYGHKDKWIFNRLLKDEYQEFIILIDSDKSLSGYYHHKLRHDYDSESGIHVIRMPSNLHEHLLVKVTFSISYQLGEFQNSPIKPVADFVVGIESWGSADLVTSKGLFSPDIQFGRMKDQFPALVIEVAYSQTGKNLAKLAKSYILGSYGNVHRVIGIDVEYPNLHYPESLQGQITAWEPCSKWEGNKFCLGTQIVIDREVFAISDGGCPQDDKSIDIPLKLFESPAFKLPDVVSEHKISLKYSDLCAWLRQAEMRSRQLKDGTAFRATLAPGQEISREELTPPPKVLTQDDEQRFQDLEGQDERRAEKRARFTI